MSIVESFLLEIQAELVNHDEEFTKSIDGWGNAKQHPKGKYYTLIYNRKKVGMTGVIILRKAYFQIAIHPAFRRKGLVKVASDLIAKKHKLKELYATINKDNIASIGAHKKAGFIEPSKEEYEELKKKKLMPKTGTVLLIKEF